ncbi:MAG TPA: hypothetical protein VH880_14570 [Anaeromyxobacteraceae bacterium]|jgi:hypothetical protein
MARFAPRSSFSLLALAALAACGAPLGESSSPVAAATPPSLPAAPATCPAPTNDVPLDMELVLPLGYLAYPTLGIFNVYWGESWDSTPGNFARADIERALRNVVATPYFDRLCQYGVPGFHFEGSAGTDGVVGCARNPGATTSTPAIFGFMSCEEFTPFTGVPLAVGLPNPGCIACGLAPVDCVNPVTLLAEPLCLATPNPTSNRVYVVLLPKGTVIDDFGSRSCTNYGAYHFQIPSRAVFSILPPFVIPGTQGRPINLAVIPTECFGTLEDLVTAITHEVVEAAVDPLPLAHWIDFSTATGSGVFDITRIGSLFTEGEANDICAAQGFTQTLFTAPDGQLVGVAPYWSNADNSCVSLDVTPPVSSAALSPAPNAAGWNAGDVDVALTAADPGAAASGVREIVFGASGAQPIASTTVPGAAAVVTFTTEGVSTLAFHAVDNAGNVEVDHAQPVRIDRTPPLVTWSGNAGSYTVDQGVAITCAASDALSGVASTTCADVAGPAWSFGLGPHTFSASATDLAGNLGSAATTFTVEVTFGSLCNLTRTFSARPHLADKLCRLLDRAAATPPGCCEELEEELEKYRKHVWKNVTRAFTRDEARTLSRLAKALLPEACRERDDEDDRGGHGEDRDLRGRGAGGHGHGHDACKREGRDD